MEKRLKKKGSILVLMLASMLFLFSCIGPIDDGFDHRNSGYKTLVINEIVAAPADGGADWIELYNAGGSYVYLRDYALVDNDTEREPVFLPDITLGPGEFYVVQAVAGTTDDGSFYLSFGLGSSDSLFLFWGLIV
ncbi:lamin tail domain-containing protein, partial [bacterium]|nr:lamin tail domain-containing protein [bacterium]